MNKGQDIWLTQEELKQMLQGTMVWSDVTPRLAPVPGRRSGIRRLGEPLRQPSATGQFERVDGLTVDRKHRSGDKPGGTAAGINPNMLARQGKAGLVPGGKLIGTIANATDPDAGGIRTVFPPVSGDGSFALSREGKPVIALLGGVGLLTVLSWGYFAFFH